MNENVRRFYMSFHQGFQDRDPNVCSVLVNDCLVSPEMKNKLIISQSILWATALLVVSLLDDKQYTLFLLALLATVSVANLNKNS